VGGAFCYGENNYGLSETLNAITMAMMRCHMIIPAWGVIREYKNKEVFTYVTNKGLQVYIPKPKKLIDFCVEIKKFGELFSSQIERYDISDSSISGKRLHKKISPNEENNS